MGKKKKVTKKATKKKVTKKVAKAKKTTSKAIKTEATPTVGPEGKVSMAKPLEVKLVNKIQKRNIYFPDSYRDERDLKVLHAEIGKRQHKGKIKTITTIKHMEVDSDGFWVTEFIIELKE